MIKGNAGDELVPLKGNKFTTSDKDNILGESRNCAKIFEGGWWYGSCEDYNINSRYSKMRWNGKKGFSCKKSEMKVRPQSFQGDTTA